MTFVLMSSKLYVTTRLIALKMGVLDVKNVKKTYIFGIISVCDFSQVGITKKPIFSPFLNIFA